MLGNVYNCLHSNILYLIGYTEKSHCPMEVHILDTVSERGIVHTITDAVHRSELRNVDLSKQKCDCGKYQQTGLPCKDAWFLLKELYPNGMPQDLFSEKYFHKDCFTMRVKICLQTCLNC